MTLTGLDVDVSQPIGFARPATGDMPGSMSRQSGRRKLVIAGAIALAVVGALLIAKPIPQLTKEEASGKSASVQQEGGRSGFWTSRSPAKGGAYRWRLLGIGILLADGAGVLIWVLTVRASAARRTALARR